MRSRHYYAYSLQRLKRYDDAAKQYQMVVAHGSEVYGQVNVVEEGLAACLEQLALSSEEDGNKVDKDL